MTLLSPKQNPFASKLFSSFPSNLVTDSRSVPDLRYVFDAPLPSSRKTRLPTRELFEESPNRDTLSFLSTSLSGARLDDEWLESVESDAPLDVNQKQKVELKTPTGIFRGMSLSVSEPHLNDV